MKALVSLLIVGALVIGGYFAFRSDKAPNTTAEGTENSVPSENPAGGKKMAFAQFVKQGGSYKCTVNQYIDGMGGSTTKGTTYIDKGMIRGEYSIQAQNISVNTSFIVRDGYSYTWTSMAPTMGFKAKVNENAASGTGASASGSYSFNSEAFGDYDCEAWTADSTMFTVPSGITFREV